MDEDERKRIHIDKKNETRTKEISKMISEGGLGSEKYYDIERSTTVPNKKTDESKDEK